jgi:hypothetical protein
MGKPRGSASSVREPAESAAHKTALDEATLMNSLLEVGSIPDSLRVI